MLKHTIYFRADFHHTGHPEIAYQHCQLCETLEVRYRFAVPLVFAPHSSSCDYESPSRLDVVYT